MSGVRLRHDRAWQTVVDLCSGKLRWQMRVPAEPDHDPDLIIGAALADIPVLLDRIDALERLLDEARPSVERDAISVLTPGWYPPERVRVTELAARLRASLAASDTPSEGAE